MRNNTGRGPTLGERPAQTPGPTKQENDVIQDTIQSDKRGML